MENYNTSIKKAILDYILKHPEQKHRFKIPISFRSIPEYGNCRVSRKSDDNWDWKRAYNLSKVRISNNLMIMGLNITKILKYFKKNISTKRYLEIPKGWDTEKLLVFIENQKAKIEEHKKLVAEDWKKSIETILKENKVFKDQLIIYFKSVAALMSTQLRQIIVNTVQDFHQFIMKFKKKQYYDPQTVFANQFNPSFPFQNSFLELDILSLGDAFDFSETLSEIHNKINGLVNEVIRSSQDVERPDNIFIKNIDKKNSLWEVQPNDQEINRMINDIDNIVKDNLDVINKVLDLYEPYRFVLKEDNVIEGYKKDPPKREDIKKKIKFYEEKLKNLRE
jgi:hypothetical protein